jgi:dGTP triphosphohydrolase
MDSKLSIVCRPYNGVIAERQIRRLKSQVLDKTKKQLVGKPKSKLAMSTDELLADYDSDEEAAAEANLPPHHRRPCQIVAKANDDSSYALHTVGMAAAMQDISAKKLLEVSMHALESSHRQQVVSSPGPAGQSMGHSSRLNVSGLNTSGVSDSHHHHHPSEEFLNGALWMGRNLTMITEDVWEHTDTFRTKHLSEVANAVADTDPHRSKHRLNLLATSGINQMLTIVAGGREKTREILLVRTLRSMRIVVNMCYVNRGSDHCILEISTPLERSRGYSP